MGRYAEITGRHRRFVPRRWRSLPDHSMNRLQIAIWCQRSRCALIDRSAVKSAARNLHHALGRIVDRATARRRSSAANTNDAARTEASSGIENATRLGSTRSWRASTLEESLFAGISRSNADIRLRVRILVEQASLLRVADAEQRGRIVGTSRRSGMEAGQQEGRNAKQVSGPVKQAVT